MFRKMTILEKKTADLVVEAGEAAGWEYSASLQSPTGPLLEVNTEKLDYQANPSSSLMDQIGQWPTFVLHHNHLSGESLSCSDWRGTSLHFNEIYAHCNDGTSYYGRVVEKEKILSLTSNLGTTLEINAENSLFKYVNDTAVAGFFRKEVICRAFKLRGYVDYGYLWGTKLIGHKEILGMNIGGIKSIGQLGNAFDLTIQNAASDLSKQNW